MLAALVACTAEEDADRNTPGVTEDAGSETTPAEGVTRGVLVMGPEVRTLTPCGEPTELWVIPVESVQRAYDALAPEAYAPVFVEVRGRREPAPSAGFGADYAGQLRLSTLLRADSASEGFGCREDVDGFAFKATGQEPFWHVRVLSDRITLATMEIPSTIFAGSAPIPTDSGWRFESVSTGPETVELRLEIRRGPCTDAMAGSVYTWEATLDVGGEVRRGCAWEGALAPGRDGSYSITG